MSKLQQFFGSSPASPVFEKVREGIATTLSRFPDNLEVRDRMEALTLLMKDPELEMELEDPYISEVVYTLIRDSSNIRNFQDDQKLMALLQRMNSKYERNQYVSDLLNRIATGKCTFCDEVGCKQIWNRTTDNSCYALPSGKSGETAADL